MTPNVQVNGLRRRTVTVRIGSGAHMVRRSRPNALLALLAAMCLIGAACGSRVVPLQGTGFGVEPGAQPTGVVPTGPAGTIAPTGSPGSPAPGTSPIVVPGDPDCRGGATDRGVTANKVKVGLVASKTGPLPGQFDSDIEAVDAFFKMVNAAGGVCGRLFELHVRDDNGSGTRNRDAAEELADEEGVFAFVGSASAPDDTGIAEISRERKIPDIGFPLTYERSESPYTYGVPGQLHRATIGLGATGSRYLNEEHGIKQMAILWVGESLVSKANAWAFEAAMLQSSGGDIEVCYEQETAVLDNNWQNYAISMKGACDPADGPFAVYSTMENNNNIKLADAMRQQDVPYEIYVPTFTSYLSSFLRDSSGNARPSTEGAYIAVPQIPFERCQVGDDGKPRPPCSHPELERYVNALHRYVPNFKAPGSFGGPGWGMASLFLETVIQCGAELTRECVLNELETMEPFSTNGFLSPTRPGDHRIYTADMVLQVRGGRFVEVRPDDKSGPSEAPDFWDDSELINWWDYFCENPEKFPSRDEIDEFVTSCDV
jgi:ABC-type branched-subunit amino acid transport system substrate-binding protein